MRPICSDQCPLIECNVGQFISKRPILTPQSRPLLILTCTFKPSLVWNLKSRMKWFISQIVFQAPKHMWFLKATSKGYCSIQEVKMSAPLETSRFQSIFCPFIAGGCKSGSDWAKWCWWCCVLPVESSPTVSRSPAELSHPLQPPTGPQQPLPAVLRWSYLAEPA